MRLIKTASISGSSLILAIALLVTIGLPQQNILVLIALWLAALPLIIGLLAVPLVSRRFADRYIRTNTHLVRLLNQQEQRLDLLSHKLNLISEGLQLPDQNTSSRVTQPAELSALTERIKLLERRVLGPLENEALLNATRFREIEARLVQISLDSQEKLN